MAERQPDEAAVLLAQRLGIEPEEVMRRVREGDVPAEWMEESAEVLRDLADDAEREAENPDLPPGSQATFRESAAALRAGARRISGESAEHERLTSDGDPGEDA